MRLVREARQLDPAFVLLLILAFVHAASVYTLGALLPATLRQEGVPAVWIGVAFTAWALGRSGFGVVAGRWFDRVGPWPLLYAGFGLFGLAGVGYALTAQPAAVVALRLVHGAAAGLYWTAALSLLGQGVTHKQRVRRVFVFNLSAGAGLFTGGLLAGVLGDIHPQLPEMVGGLGFWLVGLPLAAYASRRLPRSGAYRDGTEEVAVDRRILPLSVLAALSQLPGVITGMGMPLILRSLGAGYTLMGVAAALMTLSNLGPQGVAFLWPRLLASRYALTAVAALTAGFLGMLAASHTLLLSLTALVILQGLLGLLGMAWLVTVQRIADPRTVGRATGMLRGTGDLASAVGYTVLGAMAGELAAAEVAAAGLTLLSGVLAPLTGRRSREGSQAQRVAGD